MARTSILLALICASLLPACKSTRGDSSQVQGLVIDDAEKWPGARAEVCWVNDGFDDVKAKIKDTLEREYNKRTVFTFFGFQPCGEAPQGKIAVTIGPDLWPAVGKMGHSASAWMRMFAPPFSNGGFPVCTVAPFMADVCINNVTLHEFGHSLGLVHEQERDDSQCDKHRGQPAVGQRQVGDYDGESVMDACNRQYFGSRMRLSEGDIAAVRFLYEGISPEPKAPASDDLVDACQPCGEDPEGEAYCGIRDRESGKFVSGAWITCPKTDDQYISCETCGATEPGLRYCGLADRVQDSWLTWTAVACKVQP